MKKSLTLSLLLLCLSAGAQVFPVQVTPQITPPYSPYLSDYTAPGSRHFLLQVRANDAALANYACKLRITIEGVGITLRTKPNLAIEPLILDGGGVPQLFYGDDLQAYFHPDALDFSGLSKTDYAKNARLPEGVYRFTVEILDYNRGTVVSNKGMAVAWIVLNDPPILNTPANFAQHLVQDPTNILFSWTPRHAASPNAAFTTEYTFRLLELWPEDRNPYDAFLTQATLYEAVTTQSQLLYTMGEPALTPGRKYAWQVQARDTDGKDLFRNAGRSEVFVFRFGEALEVPHNLRMRWAKPTTLAIQWNPIKAASEEVKYRLQYRPRKRREDHRWYETRTKFTDKTLYDLEPNTEYEMKVRTETSSQESEYSPIEIFKTLRPEEEQFVCGDNIQPPPLPANTLPVFPLSVNDTIHAGGYDVVVRNVIGDGGKYYGSGFAIVPWFNGAKVRVTFEGIRVNDRFWLTSGTIRSVWNSESRSLMEEQTPLLPGSAPQAGELDITIVAADSLVTITGASIASVTRNQAGNVVLETTDGEHRVLRKGRSYAIIDETGNGYLVDEKANIAKTTATEAMAAAGRGKRVYDVALKFAKGSGRFGFDEKQFEALTHYYQHLDDVGFIAWKALSSGASDVLEAQLTSQGVDPGALRFERSGAPVSSSSNGADITLTLAGQSGGMEEELLALFSASDTIPPKVVGKVNLVTYDPARYNLEIIPVNGASIPGDLSAQEIARNLNAVYSQAVVEWGVTISPRLQVALHESFDEGESGLLSNYTADMKKVLKAFGRFQDNTYYLFLIDHPRNESTLGYMPRNRQAGFVFTGPHNGNVSEFLKTIAHELGHGAFNLKHTFSEHNLPAGMTDNVMDYSTGTALYKYQWDYIHDPQAVMGLFEGGEEVAMSTQLAALFEAELIKRLGPYAQEGGCWDEGVQRATQLSNVAGFETALYAGFLRIMLCETKQENCGNNNLDSYMCGLVNGLLQELDWIAIVEAVAGWSIDPLEIITCLSKAFPMDGMSAALSSGQFDNRSFGNTAFKCLTGVEIKEVAHGIKEFVAANWEDPYYQGQATAFAITLLSPLKATILAKLERISQYANKISEFKLLAKAKDGDELVEISRRRSEVSGDGGLETISTRKQYLQGPELPEDIAKTFTNSVYHNRKLLSSERFFKYHGINNRIGKKYTWVVKTKYRNEQELREGLAIRREWGIKIEYVSEFEVPAGTWVSEGQAASQGIGYPGGEYQAVILNVPKNWILSTTDAF